MWDILTGALVGLIIQDASAAAFSTKPCQDLLMGQYICDEPSITKEAASSDVCYPVDDKKERYVMNIRCYPAPQVQCDGREFDGDNMHFTKTVPCRPRSEKSFETALLLSIFLGMFGVDRFYLGYPALGLLKLGTFGFMLVGQLIDIILIASQVVKPADGGEYIINYFGARLTESTENVSFPVP